MTVLHPCLHCHRSSDCEIKRETQRKLRGTGITKANLRCKIPQEDFPPGARVTIRAFEIHEDDREDYRKVAIDRDGVVRCWVASGKVWIVLDAGQEIQKLHDENDKIGLLCATTDRLTRIGDDIVALCPCGIDAHRCVEGPLPSTRNGKWVCPDKQVQVFEP